MTPDSDLLRQFARTNSEAAFAELVRRHVNLVYSAALRQVNGDAHLAQDVAQTVFTDLARKAASLAGLETLTGWLYTAAHHAAANMVRGENRRRDREEKFMREPTESAPDTDWEKLRPTLDDAMHELKEADREAILLRYFENQPFIQVGAKLGLNENAARMRVERALEKLRDIFAKRGVTTATALASVISANAVQMVPATLAATLTTASLAAVGTGTFTLLKIMTATKLKLAFSAIVLAGATTAFVIQHQAQEKLRADNEALTQQLEQLQTDNANFSSQLANAGDSKKLTDNQFNELLKLRGEMGTLRQETDELVKLKEENQHLLSQIETKGQSSAQLSTEDNFKLNQMHMVDAMTSLVALIKNFVDNNGGQYPASLDQIKATMDFTYTNTDNIGLNDFVFLKPNTVDSQGKKLILRSRIPIKDPQGNLMWVYGGFDGDIPNTITTTELYGNLDSGAQQSLPSNQ